jgi:hypothetical protein
MKMETTEVSETSTISIHTPGNYPKEEITGLRMLATLEKIQFLSRLGL